MVRLSLFFAFATFTTSSLAIEVQLAGKGQIRSELHRFGSDSEVGRHSQSAPEPSVAKASEADASVSEDQAIGYLKQWRPKEDGVSEQFFKDNAKFALKAKSLPFAKQVSKSMFLQYVLPYAHFDEPRDDWRPKMYETLLPLVKDKATLQDAAEALFPAWGNIFGKQLQFKANMTPQQMGPMSQTLAKGYASCTGMSIFLADCMRAVGIPARVVGISEWNRPEKGNHNWVEIWMGDHWNFVDAVPDGNLAAWNQTWFNEQAGKQQSTPADQAIMTPLWGPEAHLVYKMSWRQPATFVPGIDVTANYQTASPLATAAAWGFMPWGGFITLILVFLTVGGAGYVYKASKEQSLNRV